MGGVIDNEPDQAESRGTPFVFYLRSLTPQDVKGQTSGSFVLRALGVSEKLGLAAVGATLLTFGLSRAF